MSMPIDMSEFETQFNEGRLSNEMDNETFERMTYLKDRMKDLEDVMKYRKEMAAFASEQAAEIVKIQREIEKVLEAIRQKRKPFDDEATNISREIREDEKKYDELNRELVRLQAELAARARLRAERGLVDSKTEDSPWRQDAFTYQLEGAHRVVAGERSILGDSPGLGKTLQSIIAVDMLRAKGTGKKVIVFTPKPVLKDYERAFKRWSPNSLVFVLDAKGKGNKSAVMDMVIHMPEVIILANYEVWRKDKTILDKIRSSRFDTVILDECHTIKSRRSKIFEDMASIVYAENCCPKCGQDPLSGYSCGICGYIPESRKFGDFCSVKNLIEMSGTTVLNRPQELWPLLYLIDRVAYPDEGKFLRDYCQQILVNGDWKWTFRSGGSERLLKKLGVKYTARTRESAGVKMPPQEVKHHELELTEDKYPKQYRFNKMLKDKAKLVFGEEQMTELETLAWYARMRQAASWPDVIQIKDCPHEPQCIDPLTDKLKCKSPVVVFPPPDAPAINESVIMDASEDIVHEAVNSDQRIVVFSHFNGVLGELSRRLEAANIRVTTLNGKTPDRMRQPIIDDFNINSTKIGEHKYDVLLVQYQSGSVGLNLSGAHQALFIEREWNSGKEEQAMDRIRRLDSQHETQVHVLHCDGTATDLIDALIEQKQKVLEGFETTVSMFEEMRKWLDE